MDRDNNINDEYPENTDDNQERVQVTTSENSAMFYKIPFNVKPPISYMIRNQGERYISGPSFTDRPIEDQIRISQISEELRYENRDSKLYDESRWRVESTLIVPSSSTESLIVENESMNSATEDKSSDFNEFAILERNLSTIECSSIETAIQERNAIETSILGCTSIDAREGRNYTESTFERNSVEANILEGNLNEPIKIERIPSIPCNIGGRRTLRPRRPVTTPYTRNSASVELRNALRPRGSPIIGEQQPRNEIYEESKCDPKV